MAFSLLLKVWINSPLAVQRLNKIKNSIYAYDDFIITSPSSYAKKARIKLFKLNQEDQKQSMDYPLEQLQGSVRLQKSSDTDFMVYMV